MRCRFELMDPNAPSAVCESEMASLALRAAWFRPRIWEVNRSEMARPAASSLAVLMRRPDDRRAMAVDKSPETFAELRWAVSDITLVLMDCDMMTPVQVRFPGTVPVLPVISLCRRAPEAKIRSRCRHFRHLRRTT